MSQFTVLPAVQVSNPSVGTDGATAPTSATEVAGVNPSGNLQPLQTDSSGSLKVTVAGSTAEQNVNLNQVGGAAVALGSTTSSASIPVVIASDQAAVSVKQATAANLNATVVQPTAANLNATVIGAGTAGTPNSGVVTVQGISGGTNIPVSLASSSITNLSTNVAQFGGNNVVTGTGASGSGIPRVTVSNDSNVIVSQSTAASLNATIVGAGTAGTPSGGVVSIQGVASGTVVPVSGTVTVSSTTANQGTPNTVANGWPVKITDGTNTGAVKAASTAAVATDPAVVVALSPNNNTLGNALYTKTTDGTNTAAVKAASTAAVATDPALVVALSPNNNTLGNALYTKTTDGTNTAAVKAASTAPAATDPALVVTVSPNTGDPALGSISGGTAGTKSYLTGGVYESGGVTLTNGQQAALQLTNTGALITSTSVTSTVITSATSTITSVASAATSTQLLASNTNRKGAYFFNDSTSTLYLAFATSASTTAYTVQIASNGFYEMPNPAVYTGAIYGIWSSANGNVRITELS